MFFYKRIIFIKCPIYFDYWLNKECQDEKGFYFDFDGFICSKCGNGKCEQWENTCNCPSDCRSSPSSCKDTDGGKVYNVKGTVTDKYGKRYTDNCYSTTGLKEYYCSSGYVRYEYHKCSNKCVNGACQEAIVPPNPHPIPAPSCTDTDGGKNYFVAGAVYVSYPNSVGMSRQADYCSGNSVVEYYCSNGKAAKTTYYCKYGCSNGACRRSGTSKCISEGGSIPVIANPPSCCAGLKLIKPISPGLVGSAGICTAHCGDGICNEKIESNYNCPSDCKISPSSCKDTDGGKNYFVKGSVDYTEGNTVSHVTDYCSGRKLVEYYCVHPIFHNPVIPETGIASKGGSGSSEGGSSYEVGKTTYYCKKGCSNGACKTLDSECKVGEWKCDDNWPKYAFACNNGKWVNIGMVPPAPPNGKWVCDKNGHLTIRSVTPVTLNFEPKEGSYCNYNNNPWKCSDSTWPGNAYFCVNNKWLKIEIPPAPPHSYYKCENGNVKIIA